MILMEVFCEAFTEVTGGSFANTIFLRLYTIFRVRSGTSLFPAVKLWVETGNVIQLEYMYVLLYMSNCVWI